MAIYRNISINFWRDSKVMDLFSPEDKFFMLYCLTNTYTNLCGCYEISIKQMSNDTGYNEETVKKLLDRLENKYKVISYDFSTNEILIINWHKYNWTNSVKLDKPLLNDIKAVKSAKFKDFLAKLYNERDTVSIPYTYPIDTTVSVSVTDTVSVNNNNDSQIKNSDIAKANKHKYGEYKNVMLKDEELQTLKKDYENWEELIKFLDEYIEMKGYKAKSHYICIKRWVAKAVEEQKRKDNKTTTNRLKGDNEIDFEQFYAI